MKSPLTLLFFVDDRSDSLYQSLTQLYQKLDQLAAHSYQVFTLTTQSKITPVICDSYISP